ncbi:MAG: recombination protein F [Ignavibacteria bacterium ADurb.Bin266]|nr:MAG: recombination protein F [Ignavibacteria bacterium ADurb.Bin266]
MLDFIRDVRLESIKIQDFKNVKCGEIFLDSGKKKNIAEIIGLYGQNGSGKTALIDALSLLKKLFCGRVIDRKYADYIRVGTEKATLTYTFTIKNEKDEIINAEYLVCIGKIEGVQENNYSESEKSEEYLPSVVWERLSLQIKSNGKVIEEYEPYINTNSSNYLFEPIDKCEMLLKGDEQAINDLIPQKKLTELSSRSFIFSRELINAVRKKHFVTDVSSIDKAILRFMKTYESLVYYGNFRLFIFDTRDASMLNMDIFPLSFNLKKGASKVNGNIVIPINGNGLIPSDAYELAEQIIDSMNVVLKEIIPGLKISIRIVDKELSPNNQLSYRVQFLSEKNSKPIPLCYESDGIKKIFCILNLLINVYNRYSFTVAIDELDSGIFEYLLGELLCIISNKGKGQLIFTSHNLRPLETLDKSCIVFTTTNEEKRYIQPTDVESTDNLRDFYYRDITLGEQSDEVYEATNNSEIAFAFKEAGEYCGS